MEERKKGDLFPVNEIAKMCNYSSSVVNVTVNTTSVAHCSYQY